MKDVHLNEYQDLAQRTSKNHDHDQIANGAMGLCGEAGEVMDLLKKHTFQGHELNRAKMAEELGDVLWYCAELATGLGVRLEDVAHGNIEKLKRRYPAGFETERSVHRVTGNKVRLAEMAERPERCGDCPVFRPCALAASGWSCSIFHGMGNSESEPACQWILDCWGLARAGDMHV